MHEGPQCQTRSETSSLVPAFARCMRLSKKESFGSSPTSATAVAAGAASSEAVEDAGAVPVAEPAAVGVPDVAFEVAVGAAASVWGVGGSRRSMGADLHAKKERVDKLTKAATIPKRERESTPRMYRFSRQT